MAPPEIERFVRVIVADSLAMLGAGLRKILAVEDHIRVVGQAENLPQAIYIAKKLGAEILIFEAALAENPLEAVQEIMKTAPSLRMVVVTEAAKRELTLELFRRGAHAIVPRGIDSEQLVECLQTIARGEPWLEPYAVKWVLEAFRTEGRPPGARPNMQLTPKELLIVSSVTQGMKNKEIAVRVGTTEQVVKNYLRKIYDKLGVADRLELALYCLNNRVALDSKTPTEPTTAPASGQGSSNQEIAAANSGTADIKEPAS